MGNEEMTLGGILRSTAARFGNNRAFAWVGEEGYTYNDVERLAGSLHNFLMEHGVSQGDRVTILGTNMPKWPVVYLAVTSMGAVAVPILPDFTSEEVENVIEHSESKLIFVSESLVQKVQKYIDGGVTPVISMESFTAIGDKGSKVAFNEANSSWSNASVSPEDLAAIIYTSGTTGRSKGVMLLHCNLASNVHDSKVLQEVNDSDIFLSLLPLSHTLENTVGMLVPLASGATVYYLSKPPTASVLLPALKEVRPTMLLEVPLII